MNLKPTVIIELKRAIHEVLQGYSGSFSDLAGDNILEEIACDVVLVVDDVLREQGEEGLIP